MGMLTTEIIKSMARLTRVYFYFVSDKYHGDEISIMPEIAHNGAVMEKRVACLLILPWAQANICCINNVAVIFIAVDKTMPIVFSRQ